MIVFRIFNYFFWVRFREELPGYVLDEYQESVPMSTYLLAFVVCDFKNLTDGNFSVWARPEVIESAQYALEVGPKILRFFEKYFNITYPLPKIQMIALPDFSAGGKYIIKRLSTLDYFKWFQKSFHQ